MRCGQKVSTSPFHPKHLLEAQPMTQPETSSLLSPSFVPSPEYPLSVLHSVFSVPLWFCALQAIPSLAT